METLRQARKYLATIPYLNSGGCAIAALALYRLLEKQRKLTKTTAVVYLYSQRAMHLYTHNCRALRGQATPAGCHHAVLYHRGQYIECGVKSNISGFSYKHNFTDVKTVVKSVESPVNWNDLFDRSRYMNEIEKQLGITLYENN